MTALASLDDVAAVARAVPESDETQVSRLLAMISANVRRYTGLDFDEAADDTVTVQPVDGEVILPQWPVTAATATQDGVAVDVEIGTSGSLYRVVGGLRRPWQPAPVVVTYTHGFGSMPDDAPDDIRMVVAEKTAERWNASSTNPTMIAGSSSQDVAGYSESTTFRLPGEGAVAWSAGHLATLNSYRRPRLGSVKLS